MWQLQKQKSSGAVAEPAPEPVEFAAARHGEVRDDRQADLLSFKVQVHRELLDEINLAQLEKLSRAQIDADAGQLIGENIKLHRVALKASERRENSRAMGRERE